MKSSLVPPCNLLVLNDLHLSAMEAGGKGVTAIQELGRLLAHTAKAHPENLPQVVFNGDFLDLDLVRTQAGEPFPDPPTRLRLVLELHPDLLPLLAKYIRQGGRFIILAGNHDMELGLAEVRNAFFHELKKHCQELPPDAICFKNGPLVEPGSFFIDHGHQYDPDNCIDLGSKEERPKSFLKQLPLGVMISRLLLSRMPASSFSGDGDKTPMHLLKKALSHGPLMGPQMIFLFYRSALQILMKSIANRKKRIAAGHRSKPKENRWPGSRYWAESSIHQPLKIFRRMYLDRSLLTLGSGMLFLLILFGLPLSPFLRIVLCATSMAIIAMGVAALPDRYGKSMQSRLAEVAKNISSDLSVPCVLFGHVHNDRRHNGAYLNPGQFYASSNGKRVIQFATLTTVGEKCRGEIHQWDVR